MSKDWIISGSLAVVLAGSSFLLGTEAGVLGNRGVPQWQQSYESVIESLEAESYYDSLVSAAEFSEERPEGDIAVLQGVVSAERLFE